MKFWKFEILEKCPGPMFQIPAKEIGFENAPMVLQIPAKQMGLENRATTKMQISTFSNLQNYLTYMGR